MTKTLNNTKGDRDTLSIKKKDYLEAIFNITKEKKCVKIRDISSALGVTPASAAGMVKRLKDKGLLIHEKYDGVRLAPEGEEVVIFLKERRDRVRAFLRILGVPEEIAGVDASIIEHSLRSDPVLHPETENQINSLLNFAISAPDSFEWPKDFKTFCTIAKERCEEAILGSASSLPSP